MAAGADIARFNFFLVCFLGLYVILRKYSRDPAEKGLLGF
jgi:hypothetical protein